MAQSKVWLCKHPISEHYEESQKEAKKKAYIADAKIIDIRREAGINPDMVEDHGLTPIKKKKAAPKKKAAAKKVDEPETSEPNSTEEE
jgi:hypothetical protein